MFLHYDPLISILQRGSSLLSTYTYTDALQFQENRLGLYGSLCSKGLRELSCRDSEWALTPKVLVPAVFYKPDAEIKVDLKKMDRRLKKLAIVGRMGIGYLQKVEFKRQREEFLLLSGKKFSLKNLVELVLDTSPEKNSKNLAHRVFRSNFPVLHMAIAIELYLAAEQQKDANFSFEPESILYDKDLQNLLVKNSQYWRKEVLKSRLRVTSSELINFK